VSSVSRLRRCTMASARACFKEGSIIIVLLGVESVGGKGVLVGLSRLLAVSNNTYI
jgi:hypothetical protein